MKILFIGTVDFSLKALEKLTDLDANIVGVCTKEESKFNADYADLSSFCTETNIACKFVEDINDDTSLDWIISLAPDVIYCFGWSSLIKQRLLSIPKYGVVGFHPADLPNNRGRHPIIWALALGLEETASTFFLMDEGADTGDIISQEKIIITKQDTAASLYAKIVDVALLQIAFFTKKLIENQAFPMCVEQRLQAGNSWRKRGKPDGLIDFRMTTEAIFNLVRALTKPYIGAHVEYKGDDVTIWSVAPVPYIQKNIEPGKVIAADEKTKRITVKTYDFAIEILEHNFQQLPTEGEYL